MAMNIIAQAFPKSYKIEYDVDVKSIASVVFEDTEGNTHIFTGIHHEGDFVVPEPFGCEFFVEDIKDRQWGGTNYEITFASSYSRDGVFYAATYNVKSI
jgi:hypothetical protein